MLLVLPVIGHAQAPIAQAPLLHDAWGVRLGALAVPEYSGAHPLFQPFYEAATSDTSPLTMIGDLTIAYIAFSSIQLPTYSSSDGLVDYGFHGGVRYVLKRMGSVMPFGAAEFGFDVYPDPVPPDPGRVSASFPLTLGGLFDVSSRTQIEMAAIARPQWYFRQGWSFIYGISIGARFLSFSE